MAIWEKITTVTTPTWTSVSEITVPTGDNTDALFWSPVTISNSITYRESDGPTPSTDGIFDWEDISSEWQYYSYQWEKLIA
jgi:hypothetical protein